MPNGIISQLMILRERNLFPSVSDKTIRLIAAEGRVRDYRVNAAVFREGHPARAIYIVLAGHIAVVHVRNGRQYVLHDEREGGTLGEVPAFSGIPYLATALSRMKSTCIAVSIETARRLVRNDPDYADWVIAQLGDRVRRLVSRVESISSLSTVQRVARFLVERDSREPGTRFRLGMSQEELAERLGAVRETISRTLSQLARAGVIAKEPGGWITVTNRPSLMDIAAM